MQGLKPICFVLSLVKGITVISYDHQTECHGKWYMLFDLLTCLQAQLLVLYVECFEVLLICVQSVCYFVLIMLRDEDDVMISIIFDIQICSV